MAHDLDEEGKPLIQVIRGKQLGRKLGFTLEGPRLIGWCRDVPGDQADDADGHLAVGPPNTLDTTKQP